MKNQLLLAATILAVVSFGTVAIAAPVTSKFDVNLGGYIKLDYIHQNAALGPLSGTVTTANKDTDQSIFTARQSRLNMTVTGPEYLGAKTRAFVEADFFGPAGTNSSGNFRMRHATFTLDWEEKGTQVTPGRG